MAEPLDPPKNAPDGYAVAGEPGGEQSLVGRSDGGSGEVLVLGLLLSVLLLLGLKYRVVGLSAMSVSRDENPILYWMGIGALVFMLVCLLASA